MCRQKTPRKTSTYERHDSTSRPAASRSQTGRAPEKLSRTDPRPGSRETTTATATITASSRSAERPRRRLENSSGIGSGTGGRSMYSTVKEGGMADLSLVVEIGVYTPAERPFQGCAALPPLHVH